MAFVDDLTFELFVLAFSGFVFVYLMSRLYLDYRHKKQRVQERLESASIAILITGVYIFLIALVSQITWFLPGAYNILFYDPFMALGVLMVAFALSARYKYKLQYVGLLGLLFGIMTIWYGVSAYDLGLTSEPLAMLALFVLFGAAGLLSYPITLILDALPGYKKRIWLGWNVILVLFWLFLVVGSLLAAYIGVSAVPAHLAKPP
jgi:putative membrane protein